MEENGSIDSRRCSPRCEPRRAAVARCNSSRGASSLLRPPPHHRARGYSMQKHAASAFSAACYWASTANALYSIRLYASLNFLCERSRSYHITFHIPQSQGSSHSTAPVAVA